MHKHAWFVAGVVILACIAGDRAFAWPFSDCKFNAERQAAADLAGAKSILINAGAGELTVRGVAGAKSVSAHGKACASTQALLAATNLRVLREGDVVRVDSVIPKIEAKPFNSDTAYIDLEISIPAELRVIVNDSSGDAEIDDIAGGEVHDTSGDLEIARVAGALEVTDSSGICASTACAAHSALRTARATSSFAMRARLPSSAATARVT